MAIQFYLAATGPVFKLSDLAITRLTTSPPEWTMMAWGGVALGVIFGLPAAFLLLLLMRHLWRHRDEGGLKGLKEGRLELGATLGLIVTGGGGSTLSSSILKAPETIVCYVLAVAVIFALTISVVVLRVLIAICNEFSVPGRPLGSASS